MREFKHQFTQLMCVLYYSQYSVQTTSESTYLESKTCFRSTCWWSRSSALSVLASATSTNVPSRTWSRCSLRHSCFRNASSLLTKIMRSQYTLAIL